MDSAKTLSMGAKSQQVYLWGHGTVSISNRRRAKPALQSLQGSVGKYFIQQLAAWASTALRSRGKLAVHSLDCIRTIESVDRLQFRVPVREKQTGRRTQPF